LGIFITKKKDNFLTEPEAGTPLSNLLISYQSLQKRTLPKSKKIKLNTGKYK